MTEGPPAQARKPWRAALFGAVLIGSAAVGLALSAHPPRISKTPDMSWAGEGPPVPAATLEPAFRPCAHCHEIGRGARHMTGPELNGVIGRAAGQVAGYPFSSAMRASHVVWDEATLRRFLHGPQELVPGTRMMFAGMSDAEMDELFAVLKHEPTNPSP